MSHLDTSQSSTANLPTSNISDQEVTILPASFAQQRLWFIDQMMAEAHHTYNISIAMHLDGQLNVTALVQALNEIVRRHASLRTTFVAGNDHPMQVIAPELVLELPLIDLSDRTEPDKQAEAETLMRQVAQHHFDLTQGPLLQTMLLRLAPEKHVLLLTIHHIISDGWSMAVFEQELAALYTAFMAGQPSPLPELPVQYADFAVWQREWLQGPVLEKQLTYWRERLGNNPPALELPTDYPRPPAQTYGGKRHNLSIPKTTVKALKMLSRQAGVTLFMTLTAAFKTLLYRYTAQEDITIGAPIANRNRTEIEPLIGFFVNTLVLRTDLSGNPTFRQLLERVSNVAFSAYVHQDLPFEKLVAELQTDRDLSRSPFFQVLFVLQNTPGEVAELPGLTLQIEGIEDGTTKFDLMLNLTETEAGLNGFFEYNTDLFAAETIERMGSHLKTLLKGIIANPDTPIDQLPLLTETERHRLLFDWNHNQTAYPRAKCIHQLFEAQVEQTPEATALIFEETKLTYQTLNRRANQLAHHLRALGVKPGDLIGLCLDRSVEMVIGLLAILKVGGAYVPLDPAYPADRLTFMLSDTQTPLLLTQRSLLEQLPAYEGQIICLDTDWQQIKQQPLANLPNEVSAQHLAYVMYTSGSTGRPKGVCVTHRNVVRLVKETNYVQLTAEEVFLLFAPISFDAATLEVWGPLLNGGRLVVFPAQMPSLETLGEVIEQYHITTLWLTAGLFHQMVDNHLDKLGGVRQLLAGGDVLSVPHVRRVLETWPDCHLINGYGPTENTTFTTCYPMQSNTPIGSSVPIGYPIANTQVYILDAHMQPVPVGVPGELYTGGDGVARGYLNRPELTAEKFIPDPFSDDPEAHLYKTGDLARYLPDGAIEFLGRMDNQVKIRGFRIELGEIETVLNQHPAVDSCVVVAREETINRQVDKRLFAYVILSKEQSATVGEFRMFLKEQLPDYMVPSAFVTLDEFPLNPNGKVDRKALPAPATTRPELETEFVAPEGPVEEMLAEVWQQVLGVEQIGIHDNFFQLGGHSLLATQVIARLHQGYDIDLPLRSLFESPTIAELTPIIEAMLIDELDDDELADLQENE